MDVLNVIQTLGFPIGCVIACGYYIYTITKQQREDSKSREEQQREDSKAREERMLFQLDKFSDSLNSFNVTLKSIDTRLEAVEKKLET